MTAIAYPKQKATADQVIDGAELEIAMFDPYRQDRVKLKVWTIHLLLTIRRLMGYGYRNII